MQVPRWQTISAMCSLNSSVLDRCPARFKQLPQPRFTFDRVVLKTPQTCERLRHPGVLPLASLRQHCHAFNVVNDRHRQPPPWSKVDLVYSPSQTFWNLMLASEIRLNPYWIESLELAFDYHLPDQATAQQAVFDLALGLRKLWPSRKSMWFENGETLRRGVIWGPTFYLEQKGKPICAKIYCRYPKLVGGGFDWSQPMARVEFTLNGGKNIKDRSASSFLPTCRASTQRCSATSISDLSSSTSKSWGDGLIAAPRTRRKRLRAPRSNWSRLTRSTRTTPT